MLISIWQSSKTAYDCFTSLALLAFMQQFSISSFPSAFETGGIRC